MYFGATQSTFYSPFSTFLLLFKLVFILYKEYVIGDMGSQKKWKNRK
jgi:hypothetical protein